MTKCRGCGIELQYEDEKAPGYTPKKDSEYCQRCFRLMHYDDLTVSMRKGIDPDEVLNRVAEMDCLILWVADLFDFEAGMISGINRLLTDKDIILAANKRDILPDTLSPDKCARFIFSRLKEQGIKIKTLVLTSKLHHEGVEEIQDAVDLYARGRKIAVIGRANSGKSTLINSLIGKNTLTMSRYPGTTLDFNEMEIDGHTYVDTPGIEIQNSMLQEVKESDLKSILPSRMIKPQIFQLRGDQSFAIGGLARIDLSGCDHATAVFYVSEDLPIHRSKISAADDLWKKHYGELFSPVPVNSEFKSYSIRKEMHKMDVVIDGMGWASVSGQISTISARVPENVHVTFRKAML